jgi:hypothetical protein
MADEYDFPVPTVNGQLITVSWLANNPIRIYRLLRTLVQQRLVSYRLLTGRVDLTGTGSGIYEITESIFSDQNGAVVNPLAEYPMTTVGVSTMAVVRAQDGLKTIISDEAIAHNRIDKVMRDLVKIANQLVFQQDATALAAIASRSRRRRPVRRRGRRARPTRSSTCCSRTPHQEENQGYSADTVVTTPTLFAYAVGRATVLNFLPREANNVLTRDINQIEIAGKTWLKTTNMPGRCVRARPRLDDARVARLRAARRRLPGRPVRHDVGCGVQAVPRRGRRRCRGPGPHRARADGPGAELGSRPDGDLITWLTRPTW